MSTLVTTALIEYPQQSQVFAAARYSEPLTWQVSGRVVTFGALARALVELAVVLLVAALLRARLTRQRL